MAAVTEILLAVIALALFVVAYGIFVLRSTLLWIAAEMKSDRQKIGAIVEMTARTIASIGNTLEEWREASSETKQD